MRALVWFRSDLRVADNPALHQACKLASDGVVAAFVICADQWREHSLADAKVDLCLRSVRSLSKALADRNIALRILHVDRFADVAHALRRLAQDLGCGSLFLNCEYEINEARRDLQVQRSFEEVDLLVQSCHDQTVVEPGQLQTKSGGDYTVYTPFRRAWLRRVEESGLPAPLPAPPKQAAIVDKPDPVPTSVAGFRPTPHLHALWPAGEAYAYRRLDEFLRRRAVGYADDRNLPAIDGTSSLSPYLANGTISQRTCAHGAVEANGGKLESGNNPGIDTWIQELIWREFYRNVVFCFPRVSMGRAFRLDTEDLPWREDPEGFQRWCDGRTGVPIVDAGMRQLAEIGWMHNRVRMITAMFLTKDMLVDWRLGERWFMRHLIDGDLASNNGGWQWAASTGTDAVPYFRVFNPYRQSKRFDRDSSYIRRWVPELSEVDSAVLHDPARLLDLCQAGLDYPPPIVDHAEARRRVLEHFRSNAGDR